MFAQVKKLMYGNGLGQAVQFAAIPILSRIYEPISFAPLYQAQALATILVIFATLQLHLALPQARDDGEVSRWSQGVVALSIVICCTLAPIIYALTGSASALVLTLCVGVTNTAINLQLYHEKFSSIARFQVMRAVAIVITQIGLQLVFKLDDLLLATIVAECAVAAMFLRRTGMRLPRPGDLRGGMRLARERTSFSVFGTMHEATSSAVFYAPLFLFSHFFSDAVGAQFAMANRLVWAPVVLLSSSAAQVAYQRFCRQSSSALWYSLQTYLRESRRHAIWASLGLIVAMLAAPPIVTRALGPNWAMAGTMIQPLILWGAVFLASIPFRSACRALSLQRDQLLIELSVGLCYFGVFLWCPAGEVAILWLIAAIAVPQNLALALIVKRRVFTLSKA